MPLVVQKFGGSSVADAASIGVADNYWIELTNANDGGLLIHIRLRRAP